jgi:hypothetical protein
VRGSSRLSLRVSSLFEFGISDEKKPPSARFGPASTEHDFMVLASGTWVVVVVRVTLGKMSPGGGVEARDAKSTD